MTDDDYDHPEWKTEFADVCNATFRDCHCDAVFRESVGREFPRFGSPTPPGIPAMCSQNYYVWSGLKNARNTTFINTTTGVKLTDCCGMCNGLNDEKELCGSYEFLPDDDSDSDRNLFSVI